MLTHVTMTCGHTNSVVDWVPGLPFFLTDSDLLVLVGIDISLFICNLESARLSCLKTHAVIRTTFSESSRTSEYQLIGGLPEVNRLSLLWAHSLPVSISFLFPSDYVNNFPTLIYSNVFPISIFTLRKGICLSCEH